MHPSKYNIIIKTRRTGKSYIINLLSGNADQLEPDEAERLNAGIFLPDDDFIQKGYFIEEADEALLYRNKYLTFLDERDHDEIQLFFIPSYNCNFSCSYCYQSGYYKNGQMLQQEVTDAFFSYITNQFAGRKKYVTLFGGEPLLNSKAHRNAIMYFLGKCAAGKMPLAVVTNGYYLEEYIEPLKQQEIKEIQVTLDGTETTHNKRRPLKSGEGTFKKIVNAIDKTLEAGMPVNLRIVIDKENISQLPQIAKFAIEKGWTNNPLFKTQLGRNYELHYCQNNQQRLMTRVEMWEAVYELINQYPEILEFHKPAFSVSKFLADNRELPAPLFDSCPGCKTEWAFDFTGRIYACTATAGKTDESIGTFYPSVMLDNKAILEWQNRDILSIRECANCNLQLACGGGCASVALNKTGHINAPDCRPVQELLEMGMEFYFKD
jgi:uncharacterized protein